MAVPAYTQNGDQICNILTYPLTFAGGSAELFLPIASDIYADASPYFDSNTGGYLAAYQVCIYGGTLRNPDYFYSALPKFRLGIMCATGAGYLTDEKFINYQTQNLARYICVVANSSPPYGDATHGPIPPGLTGDIISANRQQNASSYKYADRIYMSADQYDDTQTPPNVAVTYTAFSIADNPVGIIVTSY